MIRRLKFVGIPVADQDRALAFYRDRLGFKVHTDQPMGPGKRWIEKTSASLSLIWPMALPSAGESATRRRPAISLPLISGAACGDGGAPARMARSTPSFTRSTARSSSRSSTRRPPAGNA